MKEGWNKIKCILYNEFAGKKNYTTIFHDKLFSKSRVWCFAPRTQETEAGGLFCSLRPTWANTCEPASKQNKTKNKGNIK
jgi:hypothetical protein